MGTHTSYNECRMCGGTSFLIEDTHYDSTEKHCLNEKCGYYFVDSGTIPDESVMINGSGFRTPDEFKEFLDEMEWKKCEKCGVVDHDYNEGSPDCENCETEEEDENRHDLVK